MVDERQRRGQVEELRIAEAALRESEEHFRRVFEEGPLGLALVGKDYRFAKVNSALCRMVDYPEAELVQKTFAEITHPDDVLARCGACAATIQARHTLLPHAKAVCEEDR
jgi:PAS domain-containing protein